MKLIVIGRDRQQSQIVFDSIYVSSYHAEIIQLDNGDMFLIDKSSNGTFLNGQKITPGKEVAIHRGDNIQFADVALDWNLIEDVVLPSNVDKVLTIGSHYMNSTRLNGEGVSRFHATLRHTKDGKWFICDNSRNGTTINGKRIQRDRYVQLHKGDIIKCAGVAVENPVKSEIVTWKIVSVIAASILACLMLGCGVYWWNLNSPWPPERIYQEYASSTVLVRVTYHFEVTCGSQDLSKLPNPNSLEKYVNGKSRSYTNLCTKFVLHTNNAGDLQMVSYDGNNAMSGDATGFFLGEEGIVVTNKHVARPWTDEIIAEAVDLYQAKLNDLVSMGYIDGIRYLSQIKVKGVVDSYYIVPNNDYLDFDNLLTCHEVAVSENDNIDLALLQIKRSKIPAECTFVPYDRVISKRPKQGNVVYSLGFPLGLAKQAVNNLDKTKIQADATNGQVINVQKDNFGLSIPVKQGQSGSPVFNDRGELVGVIYAVTSGSENFNYAAYSESLLELLKQAKLDQ